MDVLLIDRINSGRRIVFRTVLDLLTINVEVHSSIRPLNRLYRQRRDQYFGPGPPVLGFDDEVADAPIVILDEEVFDMTDLAVAGMYMISGDLPDAAKSGITLASLFGVNVFSRSINSGDGTEPRGPPR